MKASILIEILALTRISKKVARINVSEDIQTALPENIFSQHVHGQHFRLQLLSKSEITTLKSNMAAKKAILPSPSRKLTESYPSHLKLGDQLSTSVKSISMYSNGEK